MAEPPRVEAAKDSAADLRRVLAVTIAWKVMALGLLLTLFWPTATVSHLVQDIRTWREFFEDVRAGLVPYVHITKEYPVLGGVLYWLMAPFVDPADLRQTVLVHGLFMAAADLVNTVLFFKAVRGISPRLALPLTLALNLSLTALVTTPIRYESVITTFVLLGYLAHRQRQFRLAALWWAVGCGLKWYPAFFLAAQEWRLFAVEKRRWHWVGAAAVFLVVTAGINLPFLLWCLEETGSIANWAAPYVFHAVRPLYWDTLLGVGQIWLGRLAWERYAGLWSLGLMAGAVLARPKMGLEDKGVLVCLAALVFNRIYSTQFNLWFYPFLLLGIARLGLSAGRTRLLLFVLLDVLNVLVYPISFTGAVDEMGGFFPHAARDGGGPWTVVFSWAIVARTLVVMAIALTILRRPILAPPEDAG
jgi:hypothetical protein